MGESEQAMPLHPITARMKQAFGVHSQVEVANILELRQSFLSDCDRRQKVTEIVWNRLILHGINPIWVETGYGHIKCFEWLERVPENERFDLLSALLRKYITCIC